MNALSSLVVGVVVIMIMSYGTGLIIGGPPRANKIITWEFQQLTKIGRMILKHAFRTLAKLFTFLADLCEKKKKKTP